MANTRASTRTRIANHLLSSTRSWARGRIDVIDRVFLLSRPRSGRREASISAFPGGSEPTSVSAGSPEGPHLRPRSLRVSAAPAAVAASPDSLDPTALAASAAHSPGPFATRLRKLLARKEPIQARGSAPVTSHLASEGRGGGGGGGGEREGGGGGGGGGGGCTGASNQK